MILPAPRLADQLPPPLRLLAGGRVERQPVTLDRFIAWYSRHFDLLGALGCVGDGRSQARVKVPLPTVLFAAVTMFWVGMESVHELEDRLRHNAGLRALLGRLTGYGKSFCEDTVRAAASVLDPWQLRGSVHAQAKRGTQQWGARYWADCELAARLRPIHASKLAAKLVIAIDGHEVFRSSTRCCSDCRARNRSVKRGGKTFTVVEYYHTIVVAQWVGTHPALVLDFEPVKPGKGELSTAYRLLERMGRQYGDKIGIVLADALYDCNPWRSLARKHGYKLVHAHRDTRRDPGRTARRELDARDRERKKPDLTYQDASNGNHYAVWEQEIPEGNQRYIEAIRTGKDGTVHKATILTDLPVGSASAVAAVLLYETRWWVENSAFHELQGRWSFGHAFVHKDRPAAAWAFVSLAILAFNAMQVYVYRHLQQQPGTPRRPLSAYRADLRETMILCSRGRYREAYTVAMAHDP